MAPAKYSNKEMISFIISSGLVASSRRWEKLWKSRKNFFNWEKTFLIEKKLSELRKTFWNPEKYFRVKKKKKKKSKMKLWNWEKKLKSESRNILLQESRKNLESNDFQFSELYLLYKIKEEIKEIYCIV